MKKMFSQVKKKNQVGWQLKGFNLMVILAILVSLVVPAKSVSASSWTGPEAAAEVEGEDTLLAEIQERGVLRMGTASGYSPYEFTVLRDGQNEVVGIDVFLGEYIADQLGVELEVVDMEFGSLIASLETGGIDMIIAGMGATEERDQSIDFSNAYELSGQSIVIREGEEDEIVDYTSFENGEHTIAVSEATLQEGYVRDFFENPDLLIMRKSGDAIAALTSGQADGVLLDDAVAGANAAENEGLTVIDSNLDGMVEDQGKSIGIPENQPSLQTAINDILEDVNDQGLIETWTEASFDIIAGENAGTGWTTYWPYFWNGIKTTLIIAGVSIFFGMILGILLALMRLTDNPVLKFLATAYIEFVRGTPLMIQVLFMFLGVGSIFGWSTMTAGLVSVSMNSGAYIAEIIRGGIQSVDKGQAEAARSLGLGYWQTMRKVIFPQSLRSIWPSLGNEFITLIKESSIVSTIGVAELTFQTRAVTSITYQAVVPLFISMIIYFIMTYALSQVLNVYERKMNQKYA
ncbi:ABC transporter substrate-binding protein/permease [Aerococcus urinaeequi]|uniref:ABC transporter substrate-binding protein/permease n=1 Tax=Aerococcus urinaeequi TaxID=51665 RepID=UPI003AAD8A7D